MCKYIKIHQIIYLKFVQSTLCEVQLDKNEDKPNQKQEWENKIRLVVLYGKREKTKLSSKKVKIFPPWWDGGKRKPKNTAVRENIHGEDQDNGPCVSDV